MTERNRETTVDVGDEVWVRGVVTSTPRVGKRGPKVAVGFRVADRVGSDYAGSSDNKSRVIDGVVRRVTEVPIEDAVTDVLLSELREYERQGWVVMALPPELAEDVVGQPATPHTAALMSARIKEALGRAAG